MEAETKFYTLKTNARRAARKAGLDPNSVTETTYGWIVPPAVEVEAPATPMPVETVAVPQEPVERPTSTVGSKTARLLLLLGEPGGATVARLTAELGWLKHTLRARLSGIAKSPENGGLGVKLERTRSNGETTYRRV